MSASRPRTGPSRAVPARRAAAGPPRSSAGPPEAELLALVADHGPDLIALLGRDGVYRYVSGNSEQLFGWRPEELTRRSPYAFVHPDDLERIGYDFCARPERQGGVRYRMRTASGGYRWAETRCRLSPDQGLIVAVTRDVELEHVRMEELERNSRFDSLTQLLNRRGLEEALEQELERSRRQGTELTVIFFDVDRFKEINDTHGHARGDEVLRHIGAAVAAQKRVSDHAGRWGGDEFLMLLPDTGPVDATRVARRIGWSLRGVLPSVTLSAGVATTAAATTGRALLREADEALYAVKHQGGAWVAVAGCSLPPPRRARAASS